MSFMESLLIAHWPGDSGSRAKNVHSIQNRRTMEEVSSEPRYNFADMKSFKGFSRNRASPFRVSLTLSGMSRADDCHYHYMGCVS